ncbi:zinc finger protein [Abeliophyllum distichum]|uniref:Zinc finger protein n=1 Tax=Abeliophyllum distichum TaxID=126358 RepID=A0ABD1UIG9_9LAMI
MNRSLCRCGTRIEMKTSWTQANPGRRFLTCQRRLVAPFAQASLFIFLDIFIDTETVIFLQQNGGCGFFSWCDPPMCPRSVEIIPGLLRSKNAYEEQVLILQKNKKMLHVRIWCIGFVCGLVVMWIMKATS